MNVKWAATMRVLRLNSLEHIMNIPGYVQGKNEQNHNNELCLKMSCVNSIILVYTNT